MGLTVAMPSGAKCYRGMLGISYREHKTNLGPKIALFLVPERTNTFGNTSERPDHHCGDDIVIDISLDDW